MKKYMLTFFGGNRALRYDNLDQAEQEAREKHFAAWRNWMAELVKANHLETGYPLAPDGKQITREGVQDYLFLETTEGGFMVIQAESLDKAAELAKSSPIINNGGYILARPCGEMTQ